MAKSEFLLMMDAIQAAAHARLRPRGFRKGGRSHNRTTAQGLVHVVNFQMDSYPIGDYVIPGIRESYYGQFWVNLAVLLPCVHRVEYTFPLPKTIRDGDCTIRSRLLHRKDSGEVSDLFDLDVDPESLADLLEQDGLPFLRQFETYEDVLAYFNAHGDLPFQNGGRASLEAALVAREVGDLSTFERLMRRAYATEHKGFREHVGEVAAKLGHAIG